MGEVVRRNERLLTAVCARASRQAGSNVLGLAANQSFCP